MTEVRMGRKEHSTLRRRLLRLLPVLGVQVTDVSHGTVMLSRSSRTRVRQLVPGAFLVETGRRGGVEVVTPTEDAALVTHGRRPWNPTMTAERVIIQALMNRVLLAHFDRYRVNCVIDVGANRGQYAQRLRRAGYRGRIVSFEPVPDEFERLQRASAQDPEWSVHRLALGSADGTLQMHVVPGALSTLSSPLPSTEFGRHRFAQLRETHQESAPVRRLDRLLDEALAGLPDPRPFLKMDTQGFDVEVFRGLGDRAREFVGLQSEVAVMQLYRGMPRLAEALQVYEAAGFEISGMYPVNRENRSGRVLEFDCLMVRADALS